MNNSHSSQHFCVLGETVGLPCSRYYCLISDYSHEKISKLLVEKKNAVVGLLSAHKTKRSTGD